MLREQWGWRPSLAILVCLTIGQAITVAQIAAPTKAKDLVKADYETGIAFERDAKWGEAIRHYESAVRKHPAIQVFKDRLTISRMHFDVLRRYRDSSFLSSVDTMSTQQTLDLYDEILKNLESNYVDSLSWSEVSDTEPLRWKYL